MQKKLFFLVALMLTMTLSVVAQVTTSSMTGKVSMEGSNEEIIGASVQAVHEPSGTRYTAVTNVNGRFTIQGMRTGGPYAVTVSYIGHQTKTMKGITLQLGETYNLNVSLSENSNDLAEVVVSGKASKFSAEKTGASTNINNEQLMMMPSLDRSLATVAKLSPYSGGGMNLAGADPRSTNFTIDGANFNNSFGLTSDLPGGGTPISIDAIEEMQVVIAPFDVRQTNFIGGGINAVTKSGTNEFKGTVYGFYRDKSMRGNKINGQDLGSRATDTKKTYGFTLGGPILKNKLFFFVNYEKELTPKEVVQYRAREDGETPGGMVSRTTKTDMERVANFLRTQYGYDPGSYTDFPAEDTNEKFLARLDWNITDAHHLALRYNKTKVEDWRKSSDVVKGGTKYNLGRISSSSMVFSNSLYYFHNDVESFSADLNSRFGQKASNQLLFTYTHQDDRRGTPSSNFPFIDIMYNGAYEPYISAGYELFTYNNGVQTKTTNVTDNFTLYAGAHKLTAGARFEHIYADNSYMRNGTGYYRFRSVDDFLNGEAPEQVAFAYGFDGNPNPTSAVRYNQIGLYLQDEWQATNRLKLTYGLRADNIIFDEQDIARNNAIYALDFGGYHIDTGRWPESKWQFSPRVGFTWDVFGDKSLKVRGGSGLFLGRFPLVYLTNMPGNAAMFQLNYIAGWNGNKFTDSLNRDAINGTSMEELFNGLQGKMLGVEDLKKYFNVPLTNENHVADQNITGVSSNFKMPQVWKSSIAVDYQLPVSFPFTITGEFIYNKSINAVYMDNINYNDDNPDAMQHFNGADNRIKYTNADLYNAGKYGIMLKNTSKGYGYTANITLNAEPVKNLKLMAAYTRTESQEVSGLPGQNAVSTWTSTISVDGPNSTKLHRSNYVTPDQVIASANYYIPAKLGSSFLLGTHIGLFYKAYSAGNLSYTYSNDMNGDGVSLDLMYIPANDNEIQFKSEADRVAFWRFVEQDDYLSSHKGQYAEAYAARAPWLHRIDLHLAEDFQLTIGKTKHKLQASLDLINLGNLINSEWGVPKIAQVCNYGQILKYEGVDATNTPIFSMNKVNGKYPTQTWDTSMSYSNCWKMQIGLKYFFN
ncbi:TonB-dependent receptor [uncultured Prevotella sp.]|uniref:TonB-dependent receptor n=1 Tax=uncultured Prevotella sp. TaxID=159272 RepID=UPI00258D82E5|nr:TonB-dependent receptor [uncultured Prevotella sp.]